jgi:hypothetical protein
MATFKSLIFSLLLLVMAFTNACKSKQKIQQIERDFIAEGYVRAVVIDYTELDGCRFLLQLEDDSKLQPIEFFTDFEINDLKVWVNYQLNPDVMSICMSGMPADIIAIELRNE